MPIAQGISKTVAYKKQSGKGSYVSGSGGKLIRRETATFNAPRDTYSSDEINSHQQYVGDTHGIHKPTGQLNGLLSGGTYADWLGSLVRKDFVAVSALTSLSLTIAAGSGSTFTITRGTGDFLAGGIKIGYVVRITAGTYTGVARDINLLVVDVTATVLTVLVLNGDTLDAQGPVASSTVTVAGKATWSPSSGHTNDYYGIEEWFSDIGRSRLQNDVKVGKCDVAMPSTGNTTVQFSMLGLSRTKAGSQALTTPTAESTSEILSAINGFLVVDGDRVVTVTGLTMSIDGQIQHGEAVIGSNEVTDLQKGDLKVSGQISFVFEDEDISDVFDDASIISLIAVATDSSAPDAEFVSFTLPALKLFSDDTDDGKKQIVLTCNYTAQYNGAGGSGVATNQTIIQIQDSLA